MEYFQTSDACQLAFEYVDRGGSTIIFIHGAHLASSEWQPQIPALTNVSYLLIDLRGHGQSDKNHPYSVPQFADDVRQLLGHLQLTDGVACGHSLGGMVAQHLAAQWPELVSKLVLVDTSYGLRSTQVDAFATDFVAPLLHLAPIPWQINLFASRLGKHSDGARMYVQTQMQKYAEDAQTYREIWRAVTHFDGYEQLSQINCPTLIVVGALNEQTHKQARFMEELVPHSKLVFIKGAGHMLNWDRARDFNLELLEFLST